MRRNVVKQYDWACWIDIIDYWGWIGTVCGWSHSGFARVRAHYCDIIQIRSIEDRKASKGISKRLISLSRYPYH